jgi:hypothetical protein
MKPLSLLLCTLALFISCSSLPTVYPVDGPPLSLPPQRCVRMFPEGKWQFLHSIEATMPGGEKALMMGLTVISSRARTARSVILTIEGLVVFDAQYDRKVTLNRGIPPFDSVDLAKGLMDDIQLMFFMPQDPLIGSGTLKNGSAVCRYQNPDGHIVDLITDSDDSWELKQYSKNFALTRTVKASPGKRAGHFDSDGIPGHLELTAYSSPGYALVMDLVEAVALETVPLTP